MAFSAIFLKLVYIFLYEQNKFPMKGFFIVSQSAEEDKISIKLEILSMMRGSERGKVRRSVAKLIKR